MSKPVSETKSVSKKMLFFKGLGLSILGAGMLFAAWLLVQNAVKDHIVNEINTAVAQGNIHLFVKHTDWQSVRKGLKHDLKQRAIHNVSLPQEPAVVDKLIEYYVRPGNVPDFLYYYNSKASHLQAKDFIRNVYFSGLTEVTVEIASPPQLDKPWLNHQEPTRAVFRLIGTQWLLKKVDAPDYLIPTQAPTTRSQKPV